MKKVLLPILLLNLSLVSAQNLAWFKQFENHGMVTFENKSVSTNINGEIANSGLFEKNNAGAQYVDFDPSVTANSVTASPVIRAIWVSKLDANGAFLWATAFDVNNNGSGKTVSKINTLGEVVVGARFLNSGDFDASAATFTMTTAANQATGFISKLNANGSFGWAFQFKQLTPSSSAFISDIELDNLNNIYVTGNFGGTIDFDPSATVNSLTAVSSTFFAKYDTDGNLKWVKTIYNNAYIGSSTAISSTLDKDKNIIVTGIFTDGIDFDPSSNSNPLTAATGTKNPFILKLDSTGLFLWAKQFEDPKTYHNNGTPVSDIAIDGNNDIYVTGATLDSLDFDPSAATYYLKSKSNYYDVYLTKLSGTGNFIWAKMFKGDYSDYAKSLAIDKNNDVYLGIDFQSFSLDMDPSPTGTFTIAAVASTSIAVNRLNANGNYASSYYFKSNSSNANYIHSMTFDNTNNLIVSGDFSLQYFTGQEFVDFDPGAAVVKGIDKFGYTDGFIVKLNNLTTGINESDINTNFKLYPNPNNGLFTLEFKNIDANTQIEIVNLLGEVVFEQKINLQTSQLNTNLKSGVYFVNTTDNNSKKSIQKIVIQ